MARSKKTPKHSKPTKRASYTTAQKLEAIQATRRFSTLADAVRALQHEDQFEKLSVSTLSTWRSQEQKLKEELKGRGEHKKIRSTAVPLLEAAMKLWCASRNERNLRWDVPLFIEQAKRVAEQMEDFPETFCFSRGWATGFLRRQGGLGYTYTDAPRVAGTKLKKERITVMVCTNSTGSDRLPPFFVGKSKSPRCFQKKSPDALGIRYVSNAKAWFTRDLTLDWLDWFGRWCRRNNPTRRVLLLLDNAPCHPPAGTFHVRGVEVRYLPPNTTSHLQPMDAGIIRAAKAYFRREMMSRSLDLAAVGVDDPFACDVLVSMYAFQNGWNTVSSTTIANCWRHAGILPEDNSNASSESDNEEDEFDAVAMVQGAVEELAAILAARPVGAARAGFILDVEELLGEADAPDWDSDEDNAAVLLDQLRTHDEPPLADDPEPEPEPDITTVLSAIRVIQIFSRSPDRGGPDFEPSVAAVLRGLGRAARHLSLSQIRSLPQSKLSDFFRPSSSSSTSNARARSTSNEIVEEDIVLSGDSEGKSDDEDEDDMQVLAELVADAVETATSPSAAATSLHLDTRSLRALKKTARTLRLERNDWDMMFIELVGVASLAEDDREAREEAVLEEVEMWE